MLALSDAYDAAMQNYVVPKTSFNSTAVYNRSYVKKPLFYIK